MTGLAPGLKLTFKLAIGRGCLGGLNVLASVTVAYGLFDPGLLKSVAEAVGRRFMRFMKTSG